MKREEEIERASVHHLYQYDYSYEEGEHLDFYIKGFTEGAKWADKNPINVWHDASEEPIFHSDIVVIDKHNGWWDIQSYDDEDYDYKELYGWEACVENYEIVRWAYIKDLLPKGDEK